MEAEVPFHPMVIGFFGDLHMEGEKVKLGNSTKCKSNVGRTETMVVG
jgi:hypothetical protein